MNIPSPAGVLCRRRIVRAAALACALALASADLSAQTPSALQWFRRGTVMIGAELGGAAFTDFHRTMARPSYGDQQLRDFERRVSASTSVSAGGWLAVWLNERWGVRAGAAFTPSSFAVRSDEVTTTSLGRTVPADERQYAGLRVLLADVGVLYRFPVTFGRVIPYGLAGGGMVRYSRSTDGELPAEALARFGAGAWTGAAGVLGLGAIIPLQKRDLLLVFELTDHISRTPIRHVASEPFEVSGVQLRLDPAGTGGDTGVGLVNNLRLMVGAVLPVR